MELKKMKHYMQRFIEVGPITTGMLISNRIKTNYFNRYWRKKALKKQASHLWDMILRNHGKKSYKDFNQFWNCARKRLRFPLNALQLTVEKSAVIKQADEYVQNYFSILGSPKKRYETIPWHTDIRLQETDQSSDFSFDSETFYKDIIITAGIEKLSKDIKVPWELSRLQHLFVLGYAYHNTSDLQYAQTFINHVTDWMNHNSFLLGANWVCPMDVGIRAINLIWALFFFKESSLLSHDFLQKIVTNLYDHLFYLEHNWELYDARTSNHYLSDLVGYFYLTYFFYDLPGIEKKAAWCHQEILKEFEKQVFQEGTDYEGSTSYHCLVTELFYHHALLAPMMGFSLTDAYMSKLKRMFDFIDWCKPTDDSSIVCIGDRDSGKILYYGITHNLIKAMKNNDIDCIKHYKEFGLSVVKTDAVHYTLRHHVYNNRQPSGHFHNDAASITVALRGVDIFIDPGSYLYTPSAQVRNQFRSVTHHSTLYIKKTEPIPLDDRLFYVAAPEQQFLSEWNTNNLVLTTSHTLYKKLQRFTAFRSVEYDACAQEIRITDIWKTDHKIDPELFGCWSFIVSPFITVKNVGDFFILEYQGKECALFQSTLTFNAQPTHVSLEYGVQMSTKKLCATVNIIHNDPIISVIKIL